MSRLRSVSLVFCLLLLACPKSAPPDVASAPPPPPPVNCDEPQVSLPEAWPGAEAADEAGCNFRIMFDAGSSGTRAHLFRIGELNEQGLPSTVTEVTSVKTSPGISAYGACPGKAAESVAALLTQGNSKGDPPLFESLPKSCMSETEVELMATAGMRLLAQDQGEQTADAIYGAIRGALEGLGLNVGTVGTIPGAHEGLYGWITVNYAEGKLVGPANETIGALDLGGASTQITFVPGAESGGDGVASLTFGDRSYPVFAYSYLGYGQDQAREHLSVPGCFHDGQGKGSSDYAACSAALKTALKPRSCDFDHCGLAATEGTAGIYQPELPGDMSFYAFSGYWYLADFMKLGDTPSPDELEQAGAAFCAMSWDEAKAANPKVPTRYLGNYCFSSAFVPNLLLGYGFSNEKTRITFVNELDNANGGGTVEAGWLLGALVCGASGCM